MASEMFKGKVKASSQGYYKGRIIKENEEFVLECEIKDGKFPLWVKKPEGYKAKGPQKREQKATLVAAEAEDII